MAARTGKITLSDTWKERIRVGVIMQRLEAHVMGSKDENDKLVELSSTQIAAAKLLLSKVVPDLASVQHQGDKDNPLQSKITVEFISASKDN